MKIKNLSREEKEKLYIKKMTALQARWENPIDEDWDELKKWSDEELDAGLKDAIGQLSFERWWSVLGIIFIVLAVLLVGHFFHK